MPKYNWETIKKEYVQGYKEEDGSRTYPSQKKLVTKYGCSGGTLGERATEEKWLEKRKKFRARTEQKSMEKKSDLLADDIVEDDLLCESFGRKALNVAKKKLLKLEERLNEDEWVSGIDILNTVNGGKVAQTIIKTAQGEPSEIAKLEGSIQTNDILLTDPDYIQAKRKVMDEYHASKSKRE